MNSVLQVLNRSVYREKLSTQNWKDFARDAYRRAGNACQICRRGNIRLNVHHVAYRDGADPWEYADEDVIVLCENCHREMHEQLRKFRRMVFGKLTPQSFATLNGALATAVKVYEPLVFAHAVAEFVSTPSMVQRYANAWNAQAQSSEETQKRNRELARSLLAGIQDYSI